MSLEAQKHLARLDGNDPATGLPVYASLCPEGIAAQRYPARLLGNDPATGLPAYGVGGCLPESPFSALMRLDGNDPATGLPVYAMVLDCCGGQGSGSGAGSGAGSGEGSGGSGSGFPPGNVCGEETGCQLPTTAHIIIDSDTPIQNCSGSALPTHFEFDAIGTPSGGPPFTQVGYDGNYLGNACFRVLFNIFCCNPAVDEDGNVIEPLIGCDCLCPDGVTALALDTGVTFQIIVRGGATTCTPGALTITCDPLTYSFDHTGTCNPPFTTGFTMTIIL